MLPRIVPALRVVNNIRGQSVRCMGSQLPDTFVPEREISRQFLTAIDDLPVPKGSWTEANNKRQTKYNIYLGSQIALLGLTVAYVWKKGIMGLNPEPFAKS